MNTEQIKFRSQHLYTIEDLLALINDIQSEELGEASHPFGIACLRYFSNPNNTYKRYHAFIIPKKNGTRRLIYAPNPTLKYLQHYLNIIFKSIYTPSKCAMGFVEEKSVIDNAQKHINKRYIYNIDLKDFFTSIPQPRVWKRLQLPPFNFQQPVVNAIAGLCCIKLHSSAKNGRFGTQYVLPQGAPTSPLLSNAICDSLDKKLEGLAQRFHATYTRYADDITFSCNSNIFSETDNFVFELNQLIEKQGFKINVTKTRLQTKAERQEVTGLIVNKKINVSRKYVRSIRQLLYIWSKYGIFEAEKKYLEHIALDTKRNKKKTKNPNLISAIKGKLEFIKMVKGQSDSTYIKLNECFEKLKNRNENSLLFKETKPLLEFGNVYFKQNKNGYKFAYYKLFNCYVRFLFISKRIDIANIKREKLYVSECTRVDGTNIKLVHFGRKQKKKP